MAIDIRTPPPLTGETDKDIVRLYDWCETLRRMLISSLSHIKGEQIESISTDKLTGIIDPTVTPISGGNIIIDEDGISVSNEDGTQYVIVDRDEVQICGYIENLNEAEAATASEEVVE